MTTQPRKWSGVSGSIIDCHCATAHGLAVISNGGLRNTETSPSSAQVFAFHTRCPCSHLRVSLLFCSAVYSSAHELLSRKERHFTLKVVSFELFSFILTEGFYYGRGNREQIREGKPLRRCSSNSAEYVAESKHGE